MAAIDVVHSSKISHVLQEDGAAQSFVEAAAGGLQNGREILQDAIGLSSDISGDDELGGGIEGHLSGGEDKASGLGGLRVGADCLRCLIGGDDVAHECS